MIMKKNNSDNTGARGRLYRLFSGFVALMALAATIACVITTYFTMKSEIRYNYDSLVLMKDGIEQKLKTGYPEPFEGLELYDKISMYYDAYIFAVIDKNTGEDVYPIGINPVYKDFDYGGSDHGHGKYSKILYHSKHDGKRYFSLYVDMDDYPYRVIFTSPYKYLFYNTWLTMGIFLASLLVLLLILMVVMQRYLVPSVDTAIKEKHKAELELVNAARIQRMAVTREFPSDPRCDVYGILKPAREVGGDMYGCLLQGDDLFFIIGDVSDKGTSAAFVMFLLSSMAYPMFKEGSSLENMVRNLNNVLCDNENYDMFCTAIVGKLNLVTRELRFMNAGHTRILIDGEFVDANTNLPLGVVRDYEFEPDLVTLSEGSTAILYTDGVTEERSEARELFGEERLRAWWSGAAGKAAAASDICDDLDRQVDSWRGKAEQSDDRAILTIKMK